MEVTMEEAGELQNSGCSSTSTNDNGACTLSDWAPVADWRPFSADTTGDFQGLIESMMCAADNSMDTEEGCRSTVYEPSTSTTTSAGSPTSRGGVKLVGVEGDGDKGLRLVHLLMAAAEALNGAHGSRDLARVILVRLREIVSLAAVGGTNMERLAHHFTDALQGLLDASPGSEGGAHHGARNGSAAAAGRNEQQQQPQPSEVLTAFQLLLDMSPYVKFGHFTSNQAILEAVGSDRRVHIVDYDIMEGVHWASLMQALVSRKDGPPPPHLRITAVTRAGGSGGGSGARKSASMVQETGRRLAAFATSIGQPFSFGQCRLDQDEKFRPSAVKVVKGETVVANCVLHPPRRSAASVASFLSGMGSLGAKLVTLVEEEEETRKGPEEESGFVARFMDELHRYSAVWDSLEAGFPMQGRARGLVEKVILGPRIAGAVGRAYRLRDKEEGNGGWGEWMAKAGFHRTSISFFNHCQARLLLGLFHDGYRVEEDEPNKLVLCWKSRRLVSASVWAAPPPPPPPSPPTSMTAAHGFTTNKHDAELLCS